jgi:hypothetical protein
MGCSSCGSGACGCSNPTNVNLNNAAIVNICARRGDTFTLKANVKDSDGTAVDLTLYTYKMEVREYDDGPLVITSSNITISGTAAGVLTITISSTNMEVDAGTYVYGLQATLISDSTVDTWFYGTFDVVQDIVEN